jgi:hypothetical protein
LSLITRRLLRGRERRGEVRRGEERRGEEGGLWRTFVVCCSEWKYWARLGAQF